MSRPPRIGDTVHFVSSEVVDGEPVVQCRASIVTSVNEEDMPFGHALAGVHLAVFDMTGISFRYATYGAVGIDCTSSQSQFAFHSGTWHWPAHAEESGAVWPAEPQTVTVHIHGSVLDKQHLAATIQDVLRRHGGGSAWSGA